MGNSTQLNDLNHTEKEFVLHSVTHPKDSSAEAARQAGITPESARTRAYEMNQKPEIQQAIAELREKIGDGIDVKQLVTDTLTNVAMNGADRDKVNAAVHLGKTQAMFTDVVETTKKDYDDQKLLDEIEEKFGKEARDKAAEELGGE